MPEEFVTNKRVSEHLDITQEYVSKLKSQGILPGGRGRQKMNLRLSRLAYINFLRTRARLSPKGTDTSISEEKPRLTKAQADKAEMEVEVITRGMIKAEEVRDGREELPELVEPVEEEEKKAEMSTNTLKRPI